MRQFRRPTAQLLMSVCVYSSVSTLLIPRPCSAQEHKIAELIRKHAVENEFSGTVAVAVRGNTVYHESFGFADRERQIHNNNKTKYAIASITKLFTSVLILQLYEEGKIDLSATVNRYLPDYNGEGAATVTIHQLLTHTSRILNCQHIGKKRDGVSEIFVRRLSLNEIIAEYCSGPIATDSRSNFEYNNTDYMILGKIVEEISGDSFDTVLKKRILVPLNMNDTGLVLGADDATTIARGYKWDRAASVFVNNPATRIENYSAAGAMYTTASDLLKFAESLFQGNLIARSTVDLLLRTYPKTRSYGYGLWVTFEQYNRTVPRVAIRTGKIHGIRTLLSRFLDARITVVILANSNRVYVRDFHEIVANELLD